MNLPNKLIGAAVARVEDWRFVSGRATYVADIAMDGLLHAAILRSPVAHATFDAIDPTPALELPGVVAVIQAADIGEIPLIPLRQQALPEGEPFRQPVIARGKVRYVGEPIAVVVSEQPAIGEDALDLLEVPFQPLPTIVDHVQAAAQGVLLFERAGANQPMVFKARKGDADAAFAAADHVRRETFSVQRHTAVPMETRGLVARWDAATERLTLYGAAKVPFFNRRTLAAMLGLEEAAVELVEVDVGGGFGVRGEFYPEDFLIPFAARRIGRPVRWIESRRDHFAATNHAREMHAEVEIACRSDGTLLAVRGLIHVDLGAYVRTNGFTSARNVAQFLTGPYRVPNIHLDATTYVTNKTPAGTYRGPGRFEASFFCERLFDMAGRDLGIDPTEFRRRNLVSEPEMPYRLARMSHVDPSSETECDGGAYVAVLDRCLDEFGWSRKKELQGRLVDGRYHGLGVGCFIEGGAAGPREAARMALEADGSVSVYVGSSALGQGLETVLAQIAADALGMAMESIRVLHGSTTLVSEGFGSFHSRSTVMGGSAILLAAQALLAEIRSAAARKLRCAPDHVTIVDGFAASPSARIALSELAAQGLSVERSFSNTKHTYSYGAHAAHVAVAPDTGHVEIIDYVTVEDVGRIVNPQTLHGQVLGAVVQGLGSVFFEQLHYDQDGQLLTATLNDYALPIASDFPRIRSFSLELRPSPNNPLGAKGAGEGGLIAVGGTISNAVAAALQSLGVEPRSLPIAPPRLWRMIDEARRSATPKGCSSKL